MTLRFSRNIAVLLLMLTISSAALAQGRAVLDDARLQQLGLQKTWSTQLPIGAQGAKLSSLSQAISPDDMQTIFEVVYQGRSTMFSSRDLNPFGKPLGDEGAKAKADQFIARLDQTKEKPELIEHHVPQVLFLAQSTSGVLTALDGQTGRKLWSQLPGQPFYPSQKASADAKYVATVNGLTLYVLHRENGELYWKRNLSSAPTTGAVIGEGHIYAPLMNGIVEIFDLNDATKPVGRFQSYGQIFANPTITEATVMWPTNRGFVYAGNSFDDKFRYRIEATGEVIASTTHLAPSLNFFATTSGYVYCIYQRDGRIEWRRSFGEPIIDSVPAIDKTAFIILQRGGMHAVDAYTGEEKWYVPGVRQFLSASSEYIYVLDNNQRLLKLELATGALMGQLSVREFNYFYSNLETDRIILGTLSGVLYVLQETGKEFPAVHIPMKTGEEEAAQPEDEEKKPEKPMEETTKPADSDPFGGGADPFGGGNPFGGGAGGNNDSNDAGGSDPFGGGGSNPFGGAMDNPFGN
ncbi:PQQ-binding-like beta-propeller repeat protein [Blastopirellula sp. JC732]|uniref:PQQ-binding-like beta-propeller repeat protein n=1 Tax=Blastopirellula sediminis TaxID=2894196 RepID=A0A9X1SHE1_9BACT|nr:PQQ-binding-like beta-propeller repeat protein [Blastopirellula sediminis]MCC9606631.1 PQQ-binding-like beta-propeller repeat protein [Blastopirellula sediminis]MCC9630072.1 PQQ-binding-like beta-propeller repeat protein [Blastopirellula sediminis]